MCFFSITTYESIHTFRSLDIMYELSRFTSIEFKNLNQLSEILAPIRQQL